MAALIGFFSDYRLNAELAAFIAGNLYIGLSTDPVSNSSGARNAVKEVASTQTVAGFTDFVVDGASNTLISSASHPFVAADLSVVIAATAGWSKATYIIGSLTGDGANLNASPAAAGTTGGTGSIIRSTGYARTALPPGFFNAPANCRTQNNAPITLPVPTGDWGTVKAIGIFDALTGGNMLVAVSVAQPRVVSAGDAAITIAAGALFVSRT